jgi:methylmalonyl-CoA epimerase
MRILGLHHVAVAVDDLQKYSSLFDNVLDIESGDVEISRANNVSLTFLDLGNVKLEFIEPLDDKSSIAKFLAKRGPGIHHICLLVDDIDASLEELKSKEIRLIDETPRDGAGGSRIAFIHPGSTGGVLLELKQEK